MNDCAVDFPPDTSEPAIRSATASMVPVPHLAAAPAVLFRVPQDGAHDGRCEADRDLLIGEVVGVLVRDGIVDPTTLRVDFNVYKPVGAWSARSMCASTTARSSA